jgi:hypothetical protein
LSAACFYSNFSSNDSPENFYPVNLRISRSKRVMQHPMAFNDAVSSSAPNWFGGK